MIDKTHPSAIPVLDNEDVREKVTDELKDKSSITTFLNKVTDEFVSRDDKRQKHRRHRTERFRQYIMSNHNGQVKDDGEYENFEGKSNRNYYFDAKLNTYKDSMMPQWMQSYPSIIGKPRHENTIKNKRLIEMMTTEFADWLQKPRYRLKKQREIEWNLLPNGNTYRYTHLNVDDPQGYVAKPVVEDDLLTTKRRGKWECPNCKTSGIMSDLDVDVCPECEFADIKKVADPSFQTKTIKNETEQIPIFEPDYEVPDAKEVCVIWKSDNIHEALAVIWTTKVPYCEIQMQFPDIAIKKGNIDSDTEFDELDDITFQRVWLSPSVYFNFKTDSPETLITNEGEIELPVDKEVLRSLFKKGLFYARAEKIIVQMYPQSISECWVHCVNKIGKIGYGIGDWDMLEYQYQKNEMRTNRMNSALSDDTQPLLYDKSVYPSGDFPNQAGATLGVVPTGSKTIHDVATRVAAGNPPINSISLDEQLDADMQSREGAMTNGSSSAPDMKAIQNTATAYMAHQNQALERRRPLLERMALHLDLEQFFQYWEIKQNYWSLAMFEEAYADYPPETVKWLKECDIKHDFDWNVAPDSFMPNTKESKQQKFGMWMQTPSAQMAMADTEKAKELSRVSDELFDGPAFDEQSEEETEAQLRLDVIIEMADKLEKIQMLSGVGIRENGYIAMDVVFIALEDAKKKLQIVDQPGEPFEGWPLDVLIDNHDVFIDVYQDYLRSPAGRKLKQLPYACVKQMIILHSQAAPLKETYIQTQYAQVQEQMMRRQAALQKEMMAGEREELMAQEEEDMARQLMAGEMENTQKLEHKDAEHEQKLAQTDEQESQKLGFKAMNQVMDADHKEYMGQQNGHQSKVKK